jgi:hypothetical protein
MKLTAVPALAAPSVGPAVITLFGTDVPVLALGLSVAGLILARVIAPPPLRKLSRLQEWSLTLLLLVILFLIVTGKLFGSGKPLEAGMATVWGIGLGFSGILAIEFFGQRVMAMMNALLGNDRRPPTQN